MRQNNQGTTQGNIQGNIQGTTQGDIQGTNQGTTQGDNQGTAQQRTAQGPTGHPPFAPLRTRIPVGMRLYLGVLSIFLLFAFTFIVYQQRREKDYKVSVLDARLQDFNVQMSEAITSSPKDIKPFIDRYIIDNDMRGLRVTLIRPDGTVFYDTWQKDLSHIHNHANRQEVRQALKEGSGHAIERKSATVPQAFFYSATYFPSHRYIVRSALPYNDNLASVLNTDKNYLWFALGAVVLLTLLLYNFTRRLGNNITKLRLFASRADHNESLDIKDLAVFPDDELGDIAERIIKVYKRYQRTRREQDELKRQLTHNIAHELKTPVASIQGYLETLINHPTIDEKTRQMFFDRCYAQSQRLSSLLADISTLNVMDEVKDLHGKETVDIARMVREIEQETALQFQQRQMRLLVSLPAELTVRGVRSMIYSIFRNLIDNALAYAGDGTTVYVKARAEDNYWLFTIADTGRGVPEEHLPRLFERFYRVDKGRSRSLGGTGLGLAIVKNAVILHRGSIRVSAREGGGLQFDFSLAKE